MIRSVNRAGQRSPGVTCALVLAGLVFGAGPLPAADEFLAGADFSHLAFFEQRGVVYRDEGEPRDALRILKDRGLNCVRLRLFTSSAAQAEANPYNSINNLEYTLPLAVRAKQAGLKLLLDFHYSDSWADPGKQNKPAAWTNLNFAGLEQRLYEYSSNTVVAFKAAGAMPEYVQLGNEITSGLLWPEGRVGGSYETAVQWSQLGRLLKAAVRGVKDAADDTPPKIIIHIDRGGDWTTTQWFFDKLGQQSVPFDIVGQSYYPFWHGTFGALSNCLWNTATRYNKPVIVAETAFPWTNSADIQAIPASTNGQVRFVVEMARIIKSVPGGKGAGIFWWGTEYQRLPGTALAGFDSRSFFDHDGNTLPVATAVGQLAAPARMGAFRSDGWLLLKWPLSAAGMTLQTTTNLAAPWVPFTNTLESDATGFQTAVPPPAEAAFFRLRSAQPP